MSVLQAGGDSGAMGDRVGIYVDGPNLYRVRAGMALGFGGRLSTLNPTR